MSDSATQPSNVQSTVRLVNEEFEKFDRLMGKVLSVSKSEIDKARKAEADGPTSSR